MNIGIVILTAAAILVYLGFAQRALDRLRLSDRAALLFLLAIIIGGFLPDIPLGGNLSINPGGGIVPLVLVGYLWSNAERKEVNRSLLAVLITTAIVFLVFKIMPYEPTYNFFLDPFYLVALIAGLVGYLAGRSRRGAFIAGTMSLILNDGIAQIENIAAGAAPSGVIGGAGVFDAIIISGFIALGLAEIFGETAEKLMLKLSGKDRSQGEGQNPEQPEKNE
ncbi:MAG TPA: DUF1614 domain-containing protein [Firmicutes bacterium]|nr:DUF1614 domain-containing protein [Bacillota bacterium]